MSNVCAQFEHMLVFNSAYKRAFKYVRFNQCISSLRQTSQIRFPRASRLECYGQALNVPSTVGTDNSYAFSHFLAYIFNRSKRERLLAVDRPKESHVLANSALSFCGSLPSRCDCTVSQTSMPISTKSGRTGSNDPQL